MAVRRRGGRRSGQSTIALAGLVVILFIGGCTAPGASGALAGDVTSRAVPVAGEAPGEAGTQSPATGAPPSPTVDTGAARQGVVKTPAGPQPRADSLRLPPPNAGADYQLGGGYPPAAGVDIVVRDHGDDPVAGKYNVCYVNGFQAQTELASWWKQHHDNLLLKKNGRYVIDANWNEIVLDISTDAKRRAITAVVGTWIDECVTKGFDAVEIDNLDSWTRSKGMLSQGHAVAYGKLLTSYAHARNLAIAQKNTSELAQIGRHEIGFDFVVAESCAVYEVEDGVPECQGYIDVYGDRVIAVEYNAASFELACARYGHLLSIVHRDVMLTTPGSPTYVYRSC